MKQTILKRSAIILAILLMGFTAFAQNRPLSGKVVDQNGDPVVGASIMVVGNSSLGTVTNVDGNYSFNVPAQASITVSCIGYSSQTVAVGGRPVINFTLEEDNEFLEETVVIGYGVQKKSDLTGAVASVRSDDLKNLSTVDAAHALQGKASGVHVITNGAPGSGADIRVRGYSSNSGNIGPLYIVDGLQVSSIQYLDPSMIESIEILKDAASAAIYGAQAGNGVVLVTTKQGREGTASVSYTSKFTRQDFTKRSMMNRADLLEYLRLEYGDAYVDGMLSSFDYSHPDYPGGVIDQDWVSAYIEPSWSKQHGISFSGGNRNGHFFTSLNYVDENGVVRGDKDVYKRLTAQINADYNLFKWLTVGINNSIEKYATKSVSQRGYSSSFENMLLMDPCTPVYWKTADEMPLDMKSIYDKVMAGDDSVRPYRFLGDENGFFANTKYSDVEGSPLAKRDATDSSSGGFNINGTMYANFMPIKGLTVTSRFGYRIAQGVSHSYTAPFYVGRGSEDNYSISANANTSYYYQWENFANYLFNIGKNNFTLMAGMSYRENNSDNVSASASGKDILSGTNYAENFHYLNYVTSDTSLATKSIGNLPSRSASLAYFGRIIWNYDNRYSIQANFRADASDTSKLPKENRWGYFPSFSAGWTVSNERFFKDNIDNHLFNFLKLRASWGRNGNINVLSGYRYTTSISPAGSWYQYHIDQTGSSYGSAPNLSGGLPNPNLHWEIAEQTDFGLDLRMFDNRLTSTIEYFNKQTKDLLFSVSTPPELGASSSTVNGGRVLNRGWEFELSWRDNIGDFSYGISGNLSTLYNRVLELADRAARQTNDPASGTNYKVRTAFEPGYPVWYLLGYVYDGTDANGDPIIRDISGDGEIASDDMTYIGQGTPKFTYGLNINLGWKGFDFTLHGAGIGGNVIMPVLHRTGFKNSMKAYLDGYKAGTMPHPSKTVAADTPFWSSTGNLFKGDYFRIKQMQLGYTLPSKLTRKVAISNLRFYVSLDDMFTFTKYPGLDPETASVNSGSGTGVDWGSYPTMEKVILGVNLTF